MDKVDKNSSPRLVMTTAKLLENHVQLNKSLQREWIQSRKLGLLEYQVS